MNQSLAKVEKEQQISAEDIDLIKRTVAAGANESEFRLFLYIAQRYNLDPLVKQIWLIKYGSAPAAIFTSRDGFLSIGHRSGQFDGMETQAVKDDNGKVTGAICRVWRKDMSHPFTVEVSRAEYDTNKGNWQKMPETMIKKVAESQCLRRAFDISGLYDPSEYDPAESVQAAQEASNAPRPVDNTAQPAPAPVAAPARPVTPAGTPILTPATSGELATDQQIQAIARMAGRKGVDDIQLNDRLTELYGVELKNLSKSDASHFIKVFQEAAK
jgi:phage recombination protein Bet